MSISMDKIVDVSVEVSNPSSIVSNFNLGLIIGNSTVIFILKSLILKLVIRNINILLGKLRW